MENQDEFIGRPISYKTYEMFRRRYKLKKFRWVLVKLDKSLDEIKMEIYNYEKNHQDEIINGLYFNVPN